MCVSATPWHSFLLLSYQCRVWLANQQHPGLSQLTLPDAVLEETEIPHLRNLLCSEQKLSPFVVMKCGRLTVAYGSTC